MTLGEIKIEALRLMHVNEDQIIDEDNIFSLEETEQYRIYLVNMVGAINRCFLDLENKGVVPLKCLTLCPVGIKKCESEECVCEIKKCGFGKHIRYDLRALAEDFLAIDRLVYENANGKYDGDAEYRVEGDSLILPLFDCKKEEYRLYYHPRIARITQYTADSYEIDVPNHVAEYIPYFVKGELYSYTDEPAEAAEAHNIYENGVMAAMRSNSKTSRIESKYSQV